MLRQPRGALAQHGAADAAGLLLADSRRAGPGAGGRALAGGRRQAARGVAGGGGRSAGVCALDARHGTAARPVRHSGAAGHGAAAVRS
ncbi:MAG: hypothetical protein MZW92_39550 [Comamonadaceae bacterium]|nr:hypothetical protein [Comamonadaceae bacterium]